MRRIRFMFVAATLLPIVALGWLAVRILNQERIADRQRKRENLEIAAGRLALGVERKLAGIEDQLSRGNGLRFSTHGIEAPDDSGLLFQSAADPSGTGNSQPATLRVLEQIEFQGQDLTPAEAAYRKL